ncbi:MAG: 30S ribosomal protein S4 [Planctomycetota bacterium]
MARYTGPACRLCRRDGAKLFLKGARCDSSKCAFERREGPPGRQPPRRGKMTDYGIHLREKQKVKHYYGLLERQFRRYFAQAERAKGNTGDVLMSLLERRLDSVVHRLGFGLSRGQARQQIAHGHITVNGHPVNIPSYQVRAGDVIRVKNKAGSLDYIRAQQAAADQGSGGNQAPDYLAVTESQIPEGIVGRLPGPEDVSIPVQTQLIVELCSR